MIKLTPAQKAQILQEQASDIARESRICVAEIWYYDFERRNLQRELSAALKRARLL